MNETTRVRATIAISALVLAGGAMMIVLFEGFNMWMMVILLTVIALAAVAFLKVSRTLKELRSGIPIQDERSKALSGRAALISFYLSMYLTLALAVVFIALEDRGVEVSNAMLLFVLVVVMGSIHGVISSYCSRKGDKAIR